MSRWSETFVQHDIHQSIENLKAFLTESPQAGDPDGVAEYRRVKKFVHYIDDIVRAVDPELTPITLLNSINQALRHGHVYNQIEAYAENRVADYLSIANNHLDSISPSLLQLKSLTSNTEEIETSASTLEVFEEFVRRSSQERSALEEQFEEQKQSAESVAEKLERLEADLTELGAHTSEKFQSGALILRRHRMNASTHSPSPL